MAGRASNAVKCAVVLEGQ